MGAPSTVREARWRLAKALPADGDEGAEAEHHLDLALLAPGEEPPDWRIHAEIVRLSHARSDDARALEHLLRALLCAPADERQGFAADAAPLVADLQSTVTAEVVRRVGIEDLDGVARSGGSDGTVTLVAGLWLILDDQDRAQALLEFAPPDAAPSDTRRLLGERIQLEELIRADRWDDALDMVDRAADRRDPNLADLLGLLLYADGRADDAEEALDVDGTLASFDVAVLRTLIVLRRAAAASYGEDRRAFTETVFAHALAASQIDPARPESTLLRAQATLEVAGDIEEGRRLLKTALRRLDREPSTLAWWRAQERVRTDEVYAFFRVEVSAALDDDDDVIERASRATFQTTDHVHDGAVREREADARLRRGDREAAQKAFEAAAGSYASGDLATRARAMMERAIDAGAGPAVRLSLVEMLYNATFSARDQDTSAADAALQHLSAIDAQVEGEDAVRACFLTGMMIERRDQMIGNDSAWNAVPYLIIAALADASETLRAANAALTLSRLQMARAAMHFADAVLAADSSPTGWVAQAVAGVRFDWSGVLDETTHALVEAAGDQRWAETVRLADDLGTDDENRIRARAEHFEVWGPWSSLVLAHTITRCDGIEAALPQFVDALGRAEAESLLGLSVEAATAIGPHPVGERGMSGLDVARRTLDSADATTLVHTRRGWEALIDALTLGGDVVRRQPEVFAAPTSPSDTAFVINVLAPTLSASFAGRRDILEAVQLIADLAAEGSRGGFDTSLTTEIDAGLIACEDSALAGIVHELLRICDLPPGDAAADLRRATYRPAQSPAAYAATTAIAVERCSETSRPVERGSS